MSLAQKQRSIIMAIVIGTLGLIAMVFLWSSEQVPVLVIQIDAGSAVLTGIVLVAGMSVTYLHGRSFRRQENGNAETRIHELEARLKESEENIRSLERSYRDEVETQIRQLMEENKTANANLEDLRNAALLFIHRISSDFSKSLSVKLDDFIPFNAFVKDTDSLKKVTEYRYELYSIAKDLRLTGRTFNLWLDMQKGDIKSYFRPVQINHLLNEILDEVLRSYDHFRPNCEAQLAPLILTVQGYQDALYQALYIMLDNAIKYSVSKNNDPTHIQKVVINSASDGTWAIITVTDNGVGIPEKQIALVVSELFTRGYNVGATSGMGIGLKVAKYIVERHSGEITLASQEGIGTQVTIRLLLAR
jgi:signal transduction histidine kinase